MAAPPRPGRPLRGARTGRPLQALLDLLGRRWALRVVWELREGARSFRDLQAACGEVSPSVLATRLDELRAAGIVVLGPGGYRLTPEGEGLLGALAPLAGWAARWGRRGGRDLRRP